MGGATGAHWSFFRIPVAPSAEDLLRTIEHQRAEPQVHIVSFFRIPVAPSTEDLLRTVEHQRAEPQVHKWGVSCTG